MGKSLPKKKTYMLFRRYVSGLTTACVIVTVIGSLLAGVSFPWITFRALVVWFGISLIGWVLIRTWSSWEITQAHQRGKSR